jgi:hypothetical protein
MPREVRARPATRHGEHASAEWRLMADVISRIRLVVLVGLALVVAACATSSATLPAVSPGSSPGAAATAHAEATDGSFRLAFDLPRATWQAGEPITGRARLEVEAGGADLGGSGSGLVGFEFREVGGHRQMGPAWTSDCRQYRLGPGAPLISGITKSGGFPGEDPDAAFYRSFFADPMLRLPPGTWEITAVAEFSEGLCDGAPHSLRAPILVTITP